MPTGIDGNPNPVATPQRDAVLARIVDPIIAARHRRVLVGIDGASGTGKSTLADEVARRVSARGRAVVRSTTDAFHRPRAERLRLGPTSPYGYYLDSHDLDAIVADLLAPFVQGERRIRTGLFDELSDASLDAFADDVPADACSSSTASSSTGQSLANTGI